ncbi:hypothetical protein FDG2_0445 [Candidatus Protofrankia californiensis]|uniref:Uncharacterized protein n=1 Tax=Candidatus Protofrankia californiensis TaxID=1839754 RepID=A0A1C3NTM0_9ACTN|nr:hypothetical protein FDG2_0445 [Candidatus Protofrankia californiensis]
MFHHALPSLLAGDNGGDRPWPELPGDKEPSRESWTVILDGTQPTKKTQGGGSR